MGGHAIEGERWRSLTSYMSVGIASREIRRENADFPLAGLKKAQERLRKGLKLPQKRPDAGWSFEIPVEYPGS